MNGKEQMIAALDGAVTEKYETMIQFIDEAFDAVKSDDAGNKKASITVPIKLTIRRNSNTGYTFHARALVKKITTEIGECETFFNPDQPELDLNGNPSGDYPEDEEMDEK